MNLASAGRVPHAPGRFVEPVSPVLALHDASTSTPTPDTSGPPSPARQEADDLTVVSLSPGHVGGGDRADARKACSAGRDRDQDQQDQQDQQDTARKRLTDSKKSDSSTFTSNSAPSLPSANALQQHKLTNSTSLAKLDVLDAAGPSVQGLQGSQRARLDTSHSVQVREHRHIIDLMKLVLDAAGPSVQGLQGSQRAHLDTSHSVQKPSRSAPVPLRGCQLGGQLGGRRGRSITITSSRQVLPPVSAIRSERWSLGGPAELFAGTKSTWDIVLGRGGGSPPTPQPCAPSSIPTVSLSLASRRASCPDQPPTPTAPSAAPSADPSAAPGIRTVSLSLANCPDQHHEPDRPVRFVCPQAGRAAQAGRDACVQVSGPPPLQLFVLPPHRCGCRGGARGASPCAWVAQAVFCQAGLALIILALAFIGAAAFHATEGPHEEEQFRELTKQQGELVISLATELRQVVPADDAWRATISRSVERHEGMVLRAAAAGYGEGGAGGAGAGEAAGAASARIWTFPGGLLFAASLLTTLGFGAPVPRTPLGRMAAVLLAVVGIPLNVILALQLGRLLCTRLPRVLPLLLPRPRNSKPAAVCHAIGQWVPTLVPVLSLLLYYLIGMLVFGAVLALPASEWLLFPLSLTAAGGVAQVPGWVRVLYAAYLEGGILLAAVAVALLQAHATTATTDFAMKLGILDLKDYYAA